MAEQGKEWSWLRRFENPTTSHFVFLMAFRTITAFAMQTYYPLEEYQSTVEIAHLQVFGYGNPQGDQKPYDLYIHLIALLYKALRIVGYDTPSIIALAPRIIGILQAATFDFFLLKLTRILLGSPFVLPTLIMNLTNWYSLLAMPRLMHNSLVTSIGTTALYYFKEGNSSEKQKPFYQNLTRSLLTIGFILKPTFILPLVFTAIHNIQLKEGIDKKMVSLIDTMKSILTMVGVSYIYDRVLLAKSVWSVVVALEEILVDLRASHDRLWLLTEGIPYILLSFSPFFVLGCLYYYAKMGKIFDKSAVLILIFLVIVLSFSKQKDESTLIILLPFLLMLSAYGCIHLDKSRLTRIVLVLSILTNICFFWFMGFYHRKASFSVMSSLRNEQENLTSLQLFTGTNTLPLQAILHLQQFIWNIPLYQIQPNEDILLFNDPKQFIKTQIDQRSPSHLIILSHFTRNATISTMLKSSGYKKVDEHYHALFMETIVGNIEDVSFVIMKKEQ